MAAKHRARICAALIVAAWCRLGTGGGPDFAKLDDLAWIAGHWAATVDDVHMEEAWIGPEGGVMLGVHRDVPAAGTAFFEYLRIEERIGEIVYIASPMGRGATEFALASLDARRAVFENPDHDFPQRITYRRDGNRLWARAEGVVNGEIIGQEWEWRLLP